MGAEDLIKALETLDSKVSKLILRKAMRKSLKPMLAQAKANAPVDTGALRNSLKIRAGKSRKGVIRLNVEAGGKNFTGDQFYGSILEFGWTDPKTGVVHPPLPFMRNAFDTKKDETTAILIDELTKSIEDTFMRGNG